MSMGLGKNLCKICLLHIMKAKAHTLCVNCVILSNKCFILCYFSLESHYCNIVMKITLSPNFYIYHIK